MKKSGKKAEPITMFLPVFREKLARLERRGKGSTNEATRLRETISEVEAMQAVPVDEELQTA